MKLKRWTIAGAAILVVAGVAPWAVGYVTEQQWLKTTEELNNAQPFVRMETSQYQRGVFGAEASTTFTLVDPASGDHHRIDFQVHISHGVTGSLLDFRPTQGWQPEGTNWFPESDPSLTLETRVWGTVTLQLQAPVMAIEDPDSGESMHGSGGLAQLKISRLGEQADMLMVWPAMVLTGPELDVKLEDLKLEQSLAWLSGDLWTGTGTMTVESLSLQSPEMPPLAMTGLALTSASEADDQGQRLDSEVGLDLESVAFAGETYGPHRMLISVDNLDVAGWNAFSSAMTDMQTLAVSAGTDPRSSFEQQMATMQRFNESIRNLAAAGFSAGIRELSLETPQGKVQGSLDISHPELSESGRADMLMVMQQLTGNVDLSMPMALAEHYPAVRLQVAPLIKQGLLVQNGDQLVLTGRMEDLVLDINGVQIPLPPLL